LCQTHNHCVAVVITTVTSALLKQ